MIVVIIELPNLKKGLSADLLFASIFARHDTLGRREDKRAVAVAYGKKLLRAPVHAPPWLRDTLHTGNGRSSRLVVHQGNIEHFLHLLPLFFDRLPVPFALQSLRNGHLEIRERYRDGFFADRTGVLEANNKVCDWVIGHRN